MRIVEPIFIRKAGKRGYAVTGQVAGYGKIRRFGLSEEEAKERFFEACEACAREAATQEAA